MKIAFFFNTLIGNEKTIYSHIKELSEKNFVKVFTIEKKETDLWKNKEINYYSSKTILKIDLDFDLLVACDEESAKKILTLKQKKIFFCEKIPNNFLFEAFDNFITNTNEEILKKKVFVIKDIEKDYEQIIKEGLNKEKIFLFQWPGQKDYKNFGDELSKVIVKWVSKKEVVLVPEEVRGKLVALGSVFYVVCENDFVWGTGFFPGFLVKENKNIKISMIRGPLSREQLLINGIDCPKVYGDPAMLMPLIYNPKIEKKHKIGLVAHHLDIDKYKNLNNYKNLKESVFFIDVRRPWKEVIDDILSCKKIVSSSLHGIIIAESYGVSAVCLKPLNEPLFKYFDYYLSTNRKVSLIETINEAIKSKAPQVPKFNTNKIISSFPKELK